MRIISGKYKGRHIPLHKGFPSRPTTDFAKENIFNVINNEFDFTDLAVLDLFAGTGSMSYEFASRGCMVTSVEKDYKSVSFIQSISKKLGISEITPVKADVFKFIKKTTEKFDIVFADPPYDLENILDIPNNVFEGEIIHPGGWLILEHGKKTQYTGHKHLINTRSYGSVQFSIFEKK